MSNDSMKGTKKEMDEMEDSTTFKKKKNFKVSDKSLEKVIKCDVQASYVWDPSPTYEPHSGWPL